MGGRLDDWLKAWTTKNRILVTPASWNGRASPRSSERTFRNHLQWSELVGGDLVISPPFGRPW